MEGANLAFGRKRCTSRVSQAAATVHPRRHSVCRCARLDIREERTMSEATKELKSDLQKGLAELTTLRDEVRVKLHLAGMELKDQWNKLEPRVAEVEKKAAAEVSEVSRAALTDVIKKLIKLRAAI